MSKYLAILLSATLVLGLSACGISNNTEVSSEATESTASEATEAVTTEAPEPVQVDPEVQRGITLGLVSADYLDDPNAPATTTDLENMGAKILELRGAEASVIAKWDECASGSDRTARNSDVAKATYYIASYLSEDGIPKTNANDNSGSRRWLPGDWHKDPHSINWDNFIKNANGEFSFYNREEAAHGNEPITTNEVNSTTAVMFSIALASHYSGQYVLPQDLETGTLLLETELTKADLLLRMVRLYDSFEDEAEYIAIDSLGTENPITDSEIANAAAVPEVNASGSSDEWIGACMENYNLIGNPDGDNSIYSTDLTWNYREADFAAAADLGMNYMRLQFALPVLAYPDYSEDRSSVNHAIIEDFDNAVRWGLKYGIHISIGFLGYLDDDIDGIDCTNADGSVENLFTPDYLAPAESYEAKAGLLNAFAKRYSNVPAKYLSFELQNENCALNNDSAANDAMADQFIMLANSIWSVTPERGVSLSTDAHTLTETEYAYWSKIAEAGINLDFHCYEPRSFLAPNDYYQVDASEMIWPGFVDEHGESWDMDKVYDTYIAPWKELADEYQVGLRIGECIPFIESWDLFDTPPRTQNAMVAWAADFSKKMQENHISYTINSNVNGFSAIYDVLPAETDIQGYMAGADYTLKTYYLDNYTCTLYINEDYAEACYNKK